MSLGRLYQANNEEFVVEVNYQLQNKTPTRCWGDLMPMEYGRINDGRAYIIELEDKRKGQCYLKKRVNRAVCGVPPRYVYHFNCTSLQ